jgi:hypothetical protein
MSGDEGTRGEEKYTEWKKASHPSRGLESLSVRREGVRKVKRFMMPRVAHCGEGH